MNTALRTRLVEVVVPVHNEQRALPDCVARLHEHLTTSFPYGFRITIADNASSDGTWRIAQELAARYRGCGPYGWRRRGAAGRVRGDTAGRAGQRDQPDGGAVR
ncbi:glycosyltransferase [Nonomuraea sp. NPDC003754]